MDKVIHCSSVSTEPGDLPHDRYHSKFVPTTRICSLVEKLTSHVMQTRLEIRSYRIEPSDIAIISVDDMGTYALPLFQ